MSDPEATEHEVPLRARSLAYQAEARDLAAKIAHLQDYGGEPKILDRLERRRAVATSGPGACT